MLVELNQTMLPEGELLPGAGGGNFKTGGSDSAAGGTDAGRTAAEGGSGERPQQHSDSDRWTGHW